MELIKFPHKNSSSKSPRREDCLESDARNNFVGSVCLRRGLARVEVKDWRSDFREPDGANFATAHEV
eukprot:1176836-Amphidinium_carterae.1